MQAVLQENIFCKIGIYNSKLCAWLSTKTHRRNDALFVLNTCMSLDYCIIPTRYLLGRRVVSSRVPDDALHTHSNVRDEDILSGKDILYY